MIEQSSEVLAKLDELKAREEAKRQPQPWIKSQKADIIFASVIIAYGLLTGIDVEISAQVWPDQVSKEYEAGMLVVQAVFAVLFLVELVLRVRADGFWYCVPFVFTCSSKDPNAPRMLKIQSCNPAGCLDTAIIVFGTFELAISLSGTEGLSLAAAGPMRLLRLMRLVRLIKGLLVFEQLKLLCAGMVSSLSAVFWAFVLLAVLMYLGSLFCVILLGKNPEVSQYFGGVGQALFTHFMIITLEAWPDISDDVMDASSPLWGLYFIVFICVTSLALMNLVTGVVCEKLIGIAKTDADEEGSVNQLEAYRKDREAFREKLAEVFQACDVDRSQTVNCEEFELMLIRPGMRRLFKLMDISDGLDPADMFKMLDAKGEGYLDFEQLAAAMLRLRGSRQRIHSLMLQRDIVWRHQREAKRVAELEENLCEQARAELSAVEDVVSAKIESLWRTAFPPRKGRVTPEFGPSLEPYSKLPFVQEEVEADALQLKQQQLDGGESVSSELVRAHSPNACQEPPALEDAQGCAATPEPEVPLERQPWVKEAGARLVALIGELDTLNSWAQELVIMDPASSLMTGIPGSSEKAKVLESPGDER